VAVGAAFRANRHDDKQLCPALTSPHAIALREHRNIKNSGATDRALKNGPIRGEPFSEMP
jgi:hypothetical protein